MNISGKQGFAAVTGVLVLAVAAWLIFGGNSEDDSTLEMTATGSHGGKARSLSKDELEPGFVMVGGVKRPASDVAPVRPQGQGPQVPPTDDRFNYGRTPRVALDATPQVKSASEAIRAKKHPERLTPLIAPKPFDAEAFKANPEQYLQTVEPGRVFQSAAPGPDVPRLAAVSPQLQSVTQGQTVKLQVKAAPKSPVTFSSFDLGRFVESQLTSVTVQANADGIATATFEGTPGTIEDVNVMAGSPTASGQIRFVVTVTKP